MKFAAFPTELKVMIMSYLSPEQLCSIVAPVCNQWTQLAYDYITWKEVKFDRPNYYLRSILEKARCRRVTFSSYQLYNNFLPITLICKTVRVLEFSYCNFGRNCNRILEQLVTCFPNIEELLLERYYLQSYWALLQDASVTENWKYLKYIRIDYVYQDVRDRFLIPIVTQDKRFEGLILLKFNDIDDNAFEIICKYQWESLQEFSMHFDKISRESYRYLPLCNNLWSLAMYYPSKMTDVEFVLILKELKNLECFGLKGADEVFKSDFQKLFKDVKMSNLTKLRIDNCHEFSDVTLKLFVKCSPSLAYLEFWRLSKVTDDGLESLVDVGSQLKELRLHIMNSLSTKRLKQLEIQLPKMRIMVRGKLGDKPPWRCL